MIKVDVLIPFHRDDDLLRASIQSAHSSIEVSVRVIAVNDTGKKISARDLGLTEFDLLVETASRGYVNAMRVAVDHSNAEFVCFLDSDDLISDYKIINQINYLTLNNLDFVSCDMAKIDVKGTIKRSRWILGRNPNSTDCRALWLIGTHGADSTLMCKGNLLRATWGAHSKFASHFADYGWALSLPDSVAIGHLPVAHYFYRSHPNQISRNANLGQSWFPIHDLWVKNFSKCFPVIEHKSEITGNISISLAFPAALTRLKRRERKILKIVIASILIEVSKQKKNDLKAWRRTLYRRGIIATRGLTPKYWLEAIPLAFSILVETTNGVRIRRIKKDN